MSEPKIIDIVTPPLYDDGSYPLFGDTALRDGLITPVVQSTGGGTDGTLVYGEFGNGGTDVDFTGIVVLNHNKSTGSSFTLNDQGGAISGLQTFTITDGYTGFTHSLISFPKISSNKLSVGFTHTSPVNQLKSIGEIIFFNENTVTLTRDFASYDEKAREKVKDLMLGDGTIHRVFTVSASGKNMRYESNCEFRYMTEAEVESLRALKESGEPFYFMPESETKPHKQYLCHWTGNFDARYSSHYKAAGYTVKMALKEVG